MNMKVKLKISNGTVTSLSITEPLDLMEQARKHFHPPVSHRDLVTVLQEQWLKIPLATVQDLYLSLPR